MTIQKMYVSLEIQSVLVHEVRAVQQACMDLEKEYRPRITFLVVQKRHHTRLFCENKEDQKGKAGNVLLVQQWTVASHIHTSSTFISVVIMESRYFNF